MLQVLRGRGFFRKTDREQGKWNIFDLESVTRLKEFLPQLDVLNLFVISFYQFRDDHLIWKGRNSNQLSWLSGVPDTVRTLSVASNWWV